MYQWNTKCVSADTGYSLVLVDTDHDNHSLSVHVHYGQQIDEPLCHLQIVEKLDARLLQTLILSISFLGRCRNANAVNLSCSND